MRRAFHNGAGMAVAHLLHGLPGCGKTTHALQLERERRALRFTHDEWMVRLYGTNPPAELFPEYFRRVHDLMWEQAERALRLDMEVILDLGFWTRASRDEARNRVRAAGGTPCLYAYACTREEMLRRVLKRTAELPPHTLEINEAAFRLFETRYEPLGTDEDPIYVDAS